jgi:hypothetical protein
MSHRHTWLSITQACLIGDHPIQEKAGPGNSGPAYNNIQSLDQ